MTPADDSDPFSDIPLDVLQAVNERCNRYETDRKAGRTRAIDEYLTGLTGDLRAVARAELEALAGAYEDLPPFQEYELLAVLGRGGMGTVYLGRHRHLDTRVAVKVLRPELAADPAARARFAREMRAAAKLTHPNVAGALDAGEEDGRLFLVTPYLVGEDLRTLVRRAGPLPVARATEYVRQAARGLTYVHARGLVHRDVKPANLFLKDDGAVVVLDLGLVLATDGTCLTASGAMLGTPAFAAPEQIDSAADVDARADVFALGGVLHYLLTGRPFDGDLPAGLPGRVRRTLRRMLAANPADRPAMADIERLLRRRSRAWVGALAAAGILLVAGLAYGLWPRPPVVVPDAPGIENVARVDPVAYRTAWAKHLGLPIEFTSDEGVTFILIPPGELPLNDELGERTLRLPTAIYFAQTELTVGQMRAVVAATGFESSVERRARRGTHAGYVFRDKGWAIGRGGWWAAAGPDRPLNPDDPAINLTWEDGDEVCRRLTDRKPGGPRYQLPTVEEWEYACRAGRTSRWYAGDDPLGWYTLYAQPFFGPVKGPRRPNAWGLFDMCGNVAEWCAEPDPARDARTLCGGKMNDPPERVTCAARVEENRDAPLGGLRLTADRGP